MPFRRVLLGALDSTVEELLRQPAGVPAGPDFEALADRLATEFAATASPNHQSLPEPNHQSLPDEALTREGIYVDHP